MLLLLGKYHDVFSLRKEEQGEIDLVEMYINTRDVIPNKQAARRIAFVVLQEVAEQLKSTYVEE